MKIKKALKIWVDLEIRYLSFFQFYNLLKMKNLIKMDKIHKATIINFKFKIQIKIKVGKIKIIIIQINKLIIQKYIFNNLLHNFLSF
jgi:hypothetical protein